LELECISRFTPCPHFLPTPGLPFFFVFTLDVCGTFIHPRFFNRELFDPVFFLTFVVARRVSKTPSCSLGPCRLYVPKFLGPVFPGGVPPSPLPEGSISCFFLLSFPFLYGFARWVGILLNGTRCFQPDTSQTNPIYESALCGFSL